MNRNHQPMTYLGTGNAKLVDTDEDVVVITLRSPEFKILNLSMTPCHANRLVQELELVTAKLAIRSGNDSNE